MARRCRRQPRRPRPHGPETQRAPRHPRPDLGGRTQRPVYGELRFTLARAEALREFTRAWCAENHIDHVDMWEPLRDRPDLLADGLHPTPAGHRALHEHLTALTR
ncbi:SGNH/GDSL hydrolase family protein [Spirillospora sp. NPDC049652]